MHLIFCNENYWNSVILSPSCGKPYTVSQASVLTVLSGLFAKTNQTPTTEQSVTLRVDVKPVSNRLLDVEQFCLKIPLTKSSITCEFD